MKYILCLKSFGDLVILVASKKNSCVTLVIGSHLKDLYYSLTNDVENTIFIDIGFPCVPPFYDIKKNNLLSIIKSYFILHYRLFKFRKKTLHVVNKKRRDFLFFGLNISELPYSGNIYYSYHSFFKQKLNKFFNFEYSSIFYIFPTSRLINKCIPQETLKQILIILKENDLKFKILLFENDPNNFLYNSFDYTIISNSFSKSLPLIKSLPSVIASDSVVSHLSEYFSVPIFVFALEHNHYWFPPSVNHLTRYDSFSSYSNFRKYILSNKSFITN